jgi:hypothetical protein
MTDEKELEMIKRLDVLRREHRSLDQQIYAITQQTPGDQFTLFKLKKMKLALRDQIMMIETVIYPDIIA